MEWHDYEIVWKPNEVYWTYDGVEVRRETDTTAARDLNKASALYMNFWTPQWDDWGRGRDDSTMPWYAKYDFVETYEYDKASDSFSLRWRDDFEGPLDMNRWRISDDWSFEQNTSTFVTEHVYTNDGNLILKMDKTISPPEPSPPAPSPPKPSPPEPEDCEAKIKIDDDAIRFGNPCNIRHGRDSCDCKMKECYQSWNASDPNGFLG